MTSDRTSNGAHTDGAPRSADLLAETDEETARGASFQADKRALAHALRELADLADDVGSRSLAAHLRDERIARLEGERFHLVVLGEFNHGKTTFVNALLGEALLPTGVTPTTSVVHHIQHGHALAARAVRADGSREPVDVARLRDFAVARPGAGDVTTAAEGTHLIEVEHPSEWLSQGVVLVDTPGVNDLNHTRAEITYGYLPRADAVIFVLDANQILKESERQFLTDKLLKTVRDRVFFVVHKVDVLSDEERNEALAYARAQLERLVASPRIYAVSAERALGGDSAGSGLPEFVTDLGRFLDEERGKVLLGRAAAEGLALAGTLRTGIEVQRRALALAQGDLARRVERAKDELRSSGEAREERKRRVRDAIAGVRALSTEDVRAFTERFAAALPAEIEASSAKDLKRYLPGFLEERFRAFAEEHADAVTRRLEKVAEDAIALFTEEAQVRSDRLEEIFGAEARRVTLDVDTFAYDVGVFALGAFGVTLIAFSNVLAGGALTLAAPLLAYVLRGRIEKEVKERAGTEGPEAIRKAGDSLAGAFDTRIVEFGERLLDLVSRADERMARSMLEALEAAQATRSGSDADASAALRESGMALVRLASISGTIAAYTDERPVLGAGATADART